MTNYVSIEELRSAASVGDLDIGTDISWAIEAAEEAIEAYCGRRFWQDTTDVTRYYSAWSPWCLELEDFASLTSIETDIDGDGTFETTWASTDYVLAPYNAVALERAYDRIETSPQGDNRFPLIARGVKITGKFGWPTIPYRVKESTVLQATQLLKRSRSAPFGIETVGVDGTPVRIRSKLDPQVEVLLSGFRKIAVA